MTSKTEELCKRAEKIGSSYDHWASAEDVAAIAALVAHARATSSRAECLAEHTAEIERLTRERDEARRRLETTPPWTPNQPPMNHEELCALRARWSAGPERYQADMDCVLATLAGVERERDEAIASGHRALANGMAAAQERHDRLRAAERERDAALAALAMLREACVVRCSEVLSRGRECAHGDERVRCLLCGTHVGDDRHDAGCPLAATADLATAGQRVIEAAEERGARWAHGALTIRGCWPLRDCPACEGRPHKDCDVCSGSDIVDVDPVEVCRRAARERGQR